MLEQFKGELETDWRAFFWSLMILSAACLVAGGGTQNKRVAVTGGFGAVVTNLVGMAIVSKEVSL